jgi:hypothetical protein
VPSIRRNDIFRHVFLQSFYLLGQYFPPSSLLPSLTPFNLPDYRLLLSSLSLGLLNCLQHQNSISEQTLKSGLVTVGRAAGVHVLTLWMYRGVDKSLARPGRKKATATENFDVHISYLLS